MATLKRRAAAASVGLSALCFASAVAAQSWQTVPIRGGIAAGIQWETGVSIIGRCQGGTFSLLLRPVHQYAPSRSHYRIDGGEWEPVFWGGAEGAQVLFSRTAARMARKMSAGGTLELRFTEEGAAPVLYQLEVPEDSTPLRSVLSDCGAPLSDPRDDLRIIDLPEWASLPRGEEIARLYPDTRRQGSGAALCIVTNAGVLTDCDVTYDSPPGAGFGAATRNLASRYRLQRAQAAELEGWLVILTVNWQIER